MINEEVVEEVLRGHLEASKWAIPRVVKVFISSTRTDFQEERKILLEQVGPEIQDMFDNTGLENHGFTTITGRIFSCTAEDGSTADDATGYGRETLVELVDMHYGTGQDVHLDPFQFDDHLHEIKRCHKVSRGCFYLCLVGEDTTPSPLPASLPAEQVTSLKERLGDDIDTLYTPDDNCSASVRSLRRPGDISDEEWNRRMATLVDQLQQLGDECPVQLRRSAVEQQLQLAAELNPDCVLGVIRVWDGSQTEPQNLKSAQKIWQCLEDTLPGDNVVRFTVPWKAEGVDPDFNEHDEYISNFQETITDKLKALINKSIEENPEINARNKPNQEVFKEALVHLAHCQKHVNATLKEVEWTGTATLEHIKHLMTSATTRHGPILVQGGHGSGKTSLINTIYVRCEEWFGKKALRVIRFAGMTPRSSYNLELLRIICSQLTLLLQPSAPCIPRDASFDPLYVNNWFQTLVRRFDVDAPDGAGHLVIILIDDLHRLNPLDSDIVAALSWLPISLPSNIHIVATTSVTPDVLKLTPVQREKFRAAECYLELPPAPEKTLESQVEKALDELTEDIGSPAMGRLSSLLTIAEFGLSETELLELLMPTSGDALELSDGFFNFSTLCSVLRKMMNRDLLREKFMSGRVLLSWKHELTSKAARKRYLLQQDTTRALHAEIANLFFSEIATQQQTQQEGTVQSHEEGKQTPFQSSLQANDVTYSLRHVEESWIHLLKSGDSSRLKQLTMCNFDFLLAAVRTVSVSYLRSILEHVRCYLLDRELELVYYTVRKSSDVLTRDTLQFGAQLICWLRSVADSSGELMARLMLSAMAWCDGYTDPLLVPLTGWLQPPLPLQIKNVIVNGGVNLIEPTPSAQHIVVVPHTGDPQLWHVMSNTLVHTFKGHSGRVLCIAMTKQSQYLLTGGEDTSIIIWDLKTFELKLRIYEHIAPVLCLTPALNNTLIASGGDDSRIIVTQLLPTGRRKAGDVVIKIDHHRGPVTNVLVTAATDILISGSSDGNVCLWALDTFTVLNTITLPSPVCRLAISSDSVFLLAACEDNQLYLHTLATGTQIHCLRGHKAKVVSIWLAGDNQRAVAGGADGRVYVFDMHSGCLVRTISTNHNSKVSGVKVTANDDFLITAGGNRITFWSFRKEDGVGIDELGVQMSGKPPNQAQRPHTASISCLDISRDGTTVVTGAMDSLINVWLLNTHELSATLEGHLANVTCLAISPNGLFVISGSEDKTARVWGLTLGLVVSVFTGHQATVTAVGVLSDSRRVVSSDRQGVLAVWVADNGTLLHTALGPTDFLAITNNMKYAVSGNGDNSLRIWPLTTHRDDERFIVSHKEEVTCFVLTADSLHVITGSRDMSLKVWQVVGGKLTQVLVGHTDQVTCVAVAVTNKSIVVSGSRDANLIVWDMDTGDDLHLLTGHLGYVTCVKLSADGTLAISGSEDKRIIAWDTKQGVPLSTLQLHLPILGVVMSTDVTRVAVHLLDSKHLPIVCLHNTPATYVKIPIYVAPAKEIEDLRPSGPKRPMKRLLKKEVSLDTYTWQKKYGHLTSSIMMTQVDERMRRRFSVSASMEEISKIPANKDLGSQCTGPEHAALVQSQHFDQLEALWNKKSPPRSRRTFQSLSKQNSRSSRRDSSENDDCPSPLEEVAGEISDLSSGD